MDTIQDYQKQVEETASFLKAHLNQSVQIGIILGTGLGGLVEEMDIEKVIPYQEIPHFPVSTVESHQGKFIIGKLGGVSVLAMQGRFHLYEGYSMQQITFPVRVMGQMGISHLIISNAAGGLNPAFGKSDIMLITDHINLQGDNPLIGANVKAWGERFPDMSSPYSQELAALAKQVALDQQIHLQQGVYAVVTGPNLETKAEYRFLRNIGADAIGMSTVPETIVAVHMGISVLAFSVITDECFPDALVPALFADIVAAANKAEPKLCTIIEGVVRKIG